MSPLLDTTILKSSDGHGANGRLPQARGATLQYDYNS